MTRIAVLGVGLIGGSIGLAARRRAEGATVAGWDPDPGALERALERGAIDERLRVGRRGARRRGGLLRVRAGERRWPRLARAALECGGDCVVTDVGSVKVAVLEELAGSGLRRLRPRAVRRRASARGRRGVGRRPRARGAVRGRDLVPDADRAHERHAVRAALPDADVDSGARPSAIAADVHDRLMATVSHLPHVLANVLVGQAARELVEESQGLPATGPSFRDATRVAGANPPLWRDIFVSNREAIARELDAYAEALDDRARAPARGRRRGAGALDRGRAGGSPAPARGPARRRPGERAARPGAQPAGHRGPDRARAGRGRDQHRRHGALPCTGHALRSNRTLGCRGGERRAGRGARRGPRVCRLPGGRRRQASCASIQSIAWPASSCRLPTSRSHIAPRSSERCPTAGSGCAGTCALRTRPPRWRPWPRSGPGSSTRSRAAPVSTWSWSARACAGPTRARPRSTSATPAR